MTNNCLNNLNNLTYILLPNIFGKYILDRINNVNNDNLNNDYLEKMNKLGNYQNEILEDNHEMVLA